MFESMVGDFACEKFMKTVGRLYLALQRLVELSNIFRQITVTWGKLSSDIISSCKKTSM